jgi:hypothetical protein
MKTWRIIVVVLAVLVATGSVVAAPKPATERVPKYDKSTEAVFKGTVDEVRDRQCPVSGGMGSHLILKVADGSSMKSIWR